MYQRDRALFETRSSTPRGQRQKMCVWELEKKSCWLVGANLRHVPQVRSAKLLIGWELFSLIWVSNSAVLFQPLHLFPQSR